MDSNDEKSLELVDFPKLPTKPSTSTKIATRMIKNVLKNI